MAQLQALLRPLLAIAVLFIILILIVGLIGKMFSGIHFGSLLSAISISREKISVAAAPAVVASGEKTAISWNHEHKSANGLYELVYPCRENLIIKTESGETISCNSSYPLGSSNSIIIIPTLEGSDTANIPVSISFTPNGADRVALSGSVQLTINPASGASTSKASTSTKGSSESTKPGNKKMNTYPIPGGQSTPPLANQNGYPDLAIELIAAGSLATTSGTETLIPKSTLLPGEQAGVRFIIKNIGSGPSGPWIFNANLPINSSGSFFISDSQASLNPGESVVFTMGFNNLKNSGANVATFTVDPNAYISRDLNRANNSFSVTINRGY
ncbi:MAG: hypothetical protein HY220_04265 [Candidatus Sungbacteria bacterium]|uniref:CARDB domain-containing protein n=1 Tax=Candidatus Sungiibacteriota bacterium TaxID=2750080 RepID=A0A9D6QSE3_9BACT|nr:hypothetical protein [Candidatus Sungbacteria bacterium]